MNGSDDSVDGWRRELMLSPTEPFPGFASDPCFNKPDGEVTVLDSNGKIDDHDSALEHENKLEERENGLSLLVDTDNYVVKSGGSIAERRAAKFGFDVSKISTSGFKSSSSLASPTAKSPYLLRTPGISPSALLESPMMLPNLQPSPTTGAFGLPHLGSESGIINSASSVAEKDSDDTYSFTFNPHGKPVSLSSYSVIQNQHPPKSLAQSSKFEVDCQHLASAQHPVNTGFEFPTQLQSDDIGNSSEINSPPDPKVSSDMVVKAVSMDYQTSNNSQDAANEMQQNECTQGEDAGIDYQDGDQKVVDLSGGTVSTSEDGYSWRKYGQKQVKGSEFPRSYYKCTHPNCPVKKKVEHSHDGQITEIVYKGVHNHVKPQPSRRSTFGSSVSCGEPLKVDEGGSVQLQNSCDDLKLGSEWRPDGLERTCSTSFTTGVSDLLPSNQGKSVGALESGGTPELSSTLASNDEEDDAAIHMGTQAADDNEPDLKKQKMEEPLIETALASRAIREPRVIVQIESEVDILDDGYRWRKYGQKVVKGNPNPRSYYKCTHPGCTVRKHVERASHNLKCVLTTYEGKHNHEVPTARNSSHTSSAGGNPHGHLALPQNCHRLKSEPQDLAPHNNRKLEYNQDYLRPNFLGNFSGGAAAAYQMKFPNMHNPMQYGPLHTTAPMIQTVPGLSILQPMGFPTSSNMDITNDSQGRPVGMLQPFFLGQPKEGDLNLKRPRQN
uniref:WRKY transcription factor n=1 Tax=Fagopyrum tataricum TaxID=62330 RepID=A0A4V1I1W5_FAGTA|nr:WRKY transcription factor [Fagopyrum tataricum]